MAAHNRLVGGSSPLSPTTQSCNPRDFPTPNTDLACHVVTDLARHLHHSLRHSGSLCRDQIPRSSDLWRRVDEMEAKLAELERKVSNQKGADPVR